MRHLVHGLHLAMLACLLIPSAFAQTGQIQGQVTDSQNAVIPNADVHIVNQATSVERKTKTNEAGMFSAPFLPPGHYKITVQAQGFNTAISDDLTLNVGQALVSNFELKVGATTQSVTVTAEGPSLNTTDGSVSTVVDRQFVANIPLNGRSLHALIQLVPGVVLTTINAAGGDTATGGGQFSVNGQRTTSNYYLVDGISGNTGIGSNFSPTASAGQTPGTTALGGTNSLVSLDALQEFRIETSSYAPEFGRTPGGQISLVTRGGTNDFHGSASYYVRNEALDANDWFANANRRPKPKERENLFSGVLGGPLYLPRFGESGPALWSGKNRLFFFFSYEGLRLQQPRTQITAVPTVALRSQAVPALQPYLNALPLPNGQDFGNGTARFIGSYSDPGSFDIPALRVDANLTKKLTSFLRISHAPSQTRARTGVLSTLQDARVRNNSFTGALTWMARSHLTADVRLNWTRNSFDTIYDLDNFSGAVVPQASQIFLPGRSPASAVFNFYTPGAAAFLWGAGGVNTQRQFNAVGTVAWSVGSHQPKFGVDYRRLLPLFGGKGGGTNAETLFFFTAQSIINSVASAYSIQTSDPMVREGIITSLSIFAQDAWRANARLTLTYGLRFERVPPPSEATGRLPRALLGIDSDPPQNPRFAPVGTPLWRSRFGEFAPRFGMAYKLGRQAGWETTLRGGVGIFYDVGMGGATNGFGNFYPFVVSKSLSGAQLQFPFSDAARVPPALDQSLPNLLNSFDPNLRMPYTVEWNAAGEQGLGRSQSITVSYVGASGHRLLANAEYYGQLLADFPTKTVNLFVQRNLTQSFYRALQVQYKRRLQNGLQALASYTLARSRDNASFDFNAAQPFSRTLLAMEFGPSDFDVRHTLSAAVTYDLPQVSGPHLLRGVGSGWGLDLLFRYQSAFPFSPAEPSVTTSDGLLWSPRPNLVPGQPLYIDDPTVPGGRRVNGAAFVAAPTGQQGNFPRNGLRGLPASQVDFALRRDFKLGERMKLQLRGEFFNLLNHPNFGSITNNISSGNFGQPSQMLDRSLGGLNALYQMGGPRSGELAVKVQF